MKNISRTVIVLSLVSFFTDTASEMLYPILPVYLQSIGFSVILIGILEGIAEATAGLSKGYFGKQSDLSGKRVPFVQLGYLLSSLSRPMMALFTYPLWIFFARTTDRLGKGIRTAARDAILSDEATPETKGLVFGFHRSMDTFGAVAGPLLALLYLYFYPKNYVTLFYIAFIPGLLAVASSLLIKEKIKPTIQIKERGSFFSFIKYWKVSSPNYKKLTLGLFAFALVNSSDVFLLLKAKESGLDDTYVIGIYIFYNLIYALFALPAGILADKLGLKTIYVFGLLLFAVVYFGMAYAHTLTSFAILFMLYGIYSAATEGIAKAWLTNLCKKEDTATAIGFYTSFQSIFTMIASSLTGFIWWAFNPTIAFLFSATLTIVIAIYLLIRLRSK